MTFDLALFGSKLQRYREQLETSLEEVSNSTGISIQDLKALENANRIPTGDEVLILADYYKCDYQFFISNEQLAPFEQTETMFRMYGDEFSREDRWAVQEFLFLCECEAFLLNLIPSVDLKPFKFMKEGTYFKGHAAKAASTLRLHLGYSSNQVGRATPHLLGWLFFANFLSDSDLQPIIDQHKQNNQPLEQYFTQMYIRALDYRSRKSTKTARVFSSR